MGIGCNYRQQIILRSRKNSSGKVRNQIRPTIGEISRLRIRKNRSRPSYRNYRRMRICRYPRRQARAPLIEGIIDQRVIAAVDYTVVVEIAVEPAGQCMGLVLSAKYAVSIRL
jgi:hypothetical protein